MITRHGFGEIKHPKPFLNYLIPLVKVSNKERKKEDPVELVCRLTDELPEITGETP